MLSREFPLLFVIPTHSIFPLSPRFYIPWLLLGEASRSCLSRNRIGSHRNYYSKDMSQLHHAIVANLSQRAKNKNRLAQQARLQSLIERGRQNNKKTRSAIPLVYSAPHIRVTDGARTHNRWSHNPELRLLSYGHHIVLLSTAIV